MKKGDFQGLTREFKGNPYITKDEIYKYFKKSEPDLKDSTLRWRIYRLKKEQILLPVRKGVYSLNKKPLFHPPISKKLQRIESLYSADFSPSLTCIIWSTEWLHQFMIQQPSTHQIIIETDKESIESLFYHVQGEFKNAYLNPEKDTIRDYVIRQKEAIIIKPIITRSPTQILKSEMEIASLEKVLVDLYCDKDLFLSYQGSELENIFANAWRNYTINLSVLMNYAKRRKRGEGLQEFLKKSSLHELYNVLRK